MRLKSYFAATVEAAMALAAKELGDDAMLVYSREASPETRYLGRYEVVFALPETAAPPAAPDDVRVAPAEPQPPPAPAGPILERLLGEIGELRTRLDRLGERLPAPPPSAPSSSPPPPARFSSLLSALSASEVFPEHLAQLSSWLETLPGAIPAELAATTLQDEMAGRISVDARLGRRQGATGVLVLVGPPGVGKTSSLVKLAARHSLVTRRPPFLVSFDRRRIGGPEQLHIFATILNAGFHASNSTSALLNTVRERDQEDLILIDTAGYSTADQELEDDLLDFLALNPEAEVALTLSAAAKPADLQRAVERFARFRPARLLFTRLDETSTLGPVWSVAVSRGLPLSFFSFGQQIPEDLADADPAWLARAVAGGGALEVAGAPTSKSIPAGVGASAAS